MSDAEKAALTALFAVIVYVAGQFVHKFFLEPIQEQRRLIGEVAFVIVFYANIDRELSTPEERAEAKKVIRKLASQFRATLWTIPLYRLFAFLRFVPKRDAVMKASSGLIGFSNSLGQVHSVDSREAIAKALNLDVRT
jgi:hypothetical protein